MPTIPEYPQEVFPRRPLKTVICQVRFHDILRVSSEEPAAFQAKVISTFPKFARGQSVGFAVIGGQVTPSVTGTSWEFHSADGKYVVGLAAGSLSLEARGYQDFEAFSKRLDVALRALSEVYSPPALTRIGLRYVNEVIRFAPREGRVDWAGWVNRDLTPQILFDDSLHASGHMLTFKEAEGVVNVRYNLQRGEVNDRSAEAFTLDMDYFSEGEIAPGQALDRVTKFNSWNYRFFRWAIGDELLNRMRQQDGREEDVILGAAVN